MFDMSWQDWIIGIGQVLFLLALVPSLKSSAKPALGTSTLTASILIFFALTYASLGLWFGTVMSTLLSLGWWILALQRYKADRNSA